MSDDNRDYISERQAARLLPFSRYKLLSLRNSGEGPPHYDFEDKAGIYYVPDEVIEWREAHYQKGGSPPESRTSP